MLYGFDVGGTKIAFAVYDHDLNCLFEDQSPTPEDYQSFLRHINKMVRFADNRFSLKGQVGLGIPGAINAQDLTVNCPNVPAIKGRPLVHDLCTLLEREIKVENDANCFLLSECFGGSTEGYKTVLGVTLGTGVGGAIFANGRLLTGKNTSAAEIGHFPLPATVFKKHPELPSLTCGCGRLMCLETYVSGTGLANLYQHYAHQSLQGPAILDRFRAGDEMAKKVVDVYFDILAAGIATAILIIDPDVIVFGGGLSKFEILIEEMNNRLGPHLLSHMQLPDIVSAQFGAEGGVRGALLINYQKNI